MISITRFGHTRVKLFWEWDNYGKEWRKLVLQLWIPQSLHRWTRTSTRQTCCWEPRPPFLGKVSEKEDQGRNVGCWQDSDVQWTYGYEVNWTYWWKKAQGCFVMQIMKWTVSGLRSRIQPIFSLVLVHTLNLQRWTHEAHRRYPVRWGYNLPISFKVRSRLPLKSSSRMRTRM